MRILFDLQWRRWIEWSAIVGALVILLAMEILLRTHNFEELQKLFDLGFLKLTSSLDLIHSLNFVFFNQNVPEIEWDIVYIHSREIICCRRYYLKQIKIYDVIFAMWERDDVRISLRIARK